MRYEVAGRGDEVRPLLVDESDDLREAIRSHPAVHVYVAYLGDPVTVELGADARQGEFQAPDRDPPGLDVARVEKDSRADGGPGDKRGFAREDAKCLNTDHGASLIDEAR